MNVDFLKIVISHKEFKRKPVKFEKVELMTLLDQDSSQIQEDLIENPGSDSTSEFKTVSRVHCKSKEIGFRMNSSLEIVNDVFFFRSNNFSKRFLTLDEKQKWT